MEKFNNLPVVELNSVELSSFVGGDNTATVVVQNPKPLTLSKPPL